MKKKFITIVTVIVMAFTVFAITPDTSSAATAKYWLKVNTYSNVVNVYKKTDGKWVPVRAMLCSCGKSGTRTPIGTFSIKKKWRWHRLMGGVSGQYVSQFYGNYLFHSVLYTKYKKPGSCLRSAYNKLGKNASHGCVRLATMDAKWIYDNCKRGTKVTTYRSTNPGPFGKPSRVAMAGKSKRSWDPTYSSKNNKKFRLKGPVISIDKADSVEFGQAFSIKAGVTAKSPYTFENLTSSVKVDKVEFCAESEDEAGAFVTVSDKSVDTQKAGTYRITYSCYNKYCGRNTVKKTFTLVVLPESAPEEPPVEPQPGDEPEAEPAAGLDDGTQGEPSSDGEPVSQGEPAPNADSTNAGETE